MSEEIKIGTTLWWIPFRSHREGWKSLAITGETRQSWLLQENSWSTRKVNKKTLQESHGQWGRQQFYTEAQKENQEWIAKHRAKITTAVQFCGDAASLKQIAQLLGVET